jgi:hypothetical protein
MLNQPPKANIECPECGRMYVTYEAAKMCAFQDKSIRDF